MLLRLCNNCIDRCPRTCPYCPLQAQGASEHLPAQLGPSGVPLPKKRVSCRASGSGLFVV